MTPGQLAFEAHHQLLRDLNPKTDAAAWSQIDDGTKKAWEAAATAARMPLAAQLYSARNAISRLLITYRDRLLGTWYEDTAKASGINMDSIGFLEHTYSFEPHEGRTILDIASGKI